MKTTSKILILGLVMVMALCYANPVAAETDFDTGAGAEADVRLNFQIVIPSFVYFRVGTAGAGNIDTINFSPTATEVATGAITAGTGGDAGGGAVNVVLISNGGNITITPSNDGGGSGLSDGSGNNISYAQINTGDGGTISAPALSDAGGTPVTIVSGVTTLSDVWTYTYTNPATPPVSGNYSGQVTYTASIP